MRLWSLLFSLLMSIGVLANTYDLSEDWLYSETLGRDNYELLIESLRAGDVLRFSNGKTYIIEKRLGNGHRTVVFSIKEKPEYVLRLPRSNAARPYALEYLDGYKMLQQSGLRIVKVDSESNAEYILAEKLPTDYKVIFEMVLGIELQNKKLLNDEGQFIHEPLEYQMIQEALSRADQIPSVELHEMETAFVRFLQDLAYWEIIRDLHEGQLAYDPEQKEWILIDWDNDNKRFTLKSDLINGIPQMMEKLFQNSEWLLPERAINCKNSDLI